MNGSITHEDFLVWANECKNHFYDFYDDHISEHIEKDADYYLRWANKYVEEFEEEFENLILPIVEELEEDDYFGTEGFNKRFA